MILDRDPAPLPPPSDREILAALDTARQILALQHDLAKGAATAWVDGRPCMCIVAAITAASRTKQIRDGCMGAVRRALPGRWASIEAAFNDWRDTTVEDAKTLLWRAKTNVGTGVAA